MNEKNHHVVIVVGKGHGKMETMRQELGMSHEEFEENIKKNKNGSGEGKGTEKDP